MSLDRRLGGGGVRDLARRRLSGSFSGVAFVDFTFADGFGGPLLSDLGT
jgi:hypothetical protein